MPERVRVGVRIRPFLPEDPEDADLSTLVIDPTHVSVGNNRVFTVDHVYRMEDDTAAVYHDSVRPIIAEFLKGYNVTVMAYGQTGTGKTHTISGLLPLIIKHIVDEGFGGDTSQLSFQFIEVYGETLRDLLSEDPAQSAKTLALYEGNPGNGSPGSNGETSGSYVAGALRVAARSRDEVHELLDYGTRMRATGATDVNEHSSRSHSIFTVFNHRTRSKLFIVDLAGSERNKKTHNVGQRFQESIAINSGLLALGNVIRALSRNCNNPIEAPGHVPYRSSKLTRLLQDGLGGSGKTLFLACVAPDSYNKDETLRTLQYCALALRILNTPMLQYKTLHQEQIRPYRRTNTAAADENLLDGGGDVSLTQSPTSAAAAELNMRLQEELENYKEFCNQQEMEIMSMREKSAALTSRVQTCEEELRKDQAVFTQQIDEIKQLVDENKSLRQRVAVLEAQRGVGVEAAAANRQGSLSPMSENGEEYSISSMVKGILRAQQRPATGIAAENHWEPGVPQRGGNSPLFSNDAEGFSGYRPMSQSAVQRTADTEGEWKPPVAGAFRSTIPFSDINSRPPTASHTDPSSAPQVTTPEMAAGRDDQLLALTKEALYYQTNNTELRHQLSSVVSMLEAQKRESAMLKHELHEIHQLLHNNNTK